LFRSENDAANTLCPSFTAIDFCRAAGGVRWQQRRNAAARRRSKPRWFNPTAAAANTGAESSAYGFAGAIPVARDDFFTSTYGRAKPKPFATG
jgi:hypothetical protein